MEFLLGYVLGVCWSLIICWIIVKQVTDIPTRNGYQLRDQGESLDINNPPTGGSVARSSKKPSIPPPWTDFGR